MSVAITGSNLTGTSLITFSGTGNNTVSSGFTVASATSITGVIVPSGATTGPVTVTNPSGASLGLLFTIDQLPVLSTFAPNHAPAGTSITIAGANLTGSSLITFSGSSNNTVSGGFTVASATSITGVIVPSGAITGPVTITTPSGTSLGLSFTLDSPTVTAADMKTAVKTAFESYAGLTESQIIGDMYLRGPSITTQSYTPGTGPILPRTTKASNWTNGASVTLDKVVYSILGGRITSLIVFAHDGSNNSKIYTNARTSISLMHYSRRLNDHLQINDGTDEYITLRNIYYPIFRGGRRYIPDDMTDTLIWALPNRRRAPLRAGSALSNLIEASLYTDVLGILNKEENGLVSTELASQIPLATDPLFPNSTLFAFQALRLNGSLTRLDSRFDTVALTGTSFNRADRVNLLQRAYLRYGANINLLSIDNGSHITWHLNAGWSGTITRVSRPNGTDFREFNAYSKVWSGEAICSVRRLGNFGCDIGFTALYWHVANSELVSNDEYQAVWKPNALVYYHPTNSPSNKLFLRFAAWTFPDFKSRSYLQIQFGYTIGIGSISKSFAPAAPQEVANRLQSSPVN